MSALGHDLVGNALGNLLILIRLHGVLATALGLGTQVGGVAEHLGQRNHSSHAGGTVLRLLVGDLAAAAVQAPITLPMYSSGTITLTFMMGSMMTGSHFFMASLNAIEPAMENAISEESTS